MHVPVHCVGQCLYVFGVLADQEWRKIVVDRGCDSVATAPASIGLSISGAPIRQRDGRRDQVEMPVVAVLGVHKDFIQRHREQAALRVTIALMGSDELFQART